MAITSGSGLGERAGPPWNRRLLQGVRVRFGTAPQLPERCPSSLLSMEMSHRGPFRSLPRWGLPASGRLQTWCSRVARYRAGRLVDIEEVVPEDTAVSRRHLCLLSSAGLANGRAGRAASRRRRRVPLSGVGHRHVTVRQWRVNTAIEARRPKLRKGIDGGRWLARCGLPTCRVRATADMSQPLLRE